jgi:X-Pro dipeptidyl-peptidase-like protein
MRIKAIVPAAFLCLASIAVPVAGHADSTVAGLVCAPRGDLTICSGEVSSWDGSPLDVDLTLPQRSEGSRHPLIVMLHGFGNNKHEWESITDSGDNGDKWHWNNHWFAKHGFYALNYTARGFFDDGPTDPSYQPATPAGVPVPCTRPGSACPPNGTIHLKSRDYEIRDTQWLAALVAAAYPDLDRSQVAVTGGSYGGGEAWLQASQSVWDANAFANHPPDPPLPVLQLQVAVPKYPWTDLGYSLAPNGHPGPFDPTMFTSSTGSPTSDSGDGNPLGVVKYSYATGFLFLGATDGFFETQPENIPGWYLDAVQGGDPYDAGSPGTDRPGYIRELRRGLTELRGAYYQDQQWAAQAGNREVAIFSISGWTDDLFPPVEAFRQFKYLKSLDRLWPVELAVADVGHPRAQNPAFEWHHLNDQAWGFLKEQIHGSHRQQTHVFSMPTICPSPATDANGPNQRLTGRTPEDLSSGSLTVNYATAGTLLNRKVGPIVPQPPPPADPDADNMQTDPAFGSALFGLPACRESIQSDTAPTVRYTAVSAPLDRPRIYVGLGHVRVEYTMTGGTTGTLNARVWDIGPNGKAWLMTRGTYRIDGNPAPTPAGYDPLPSGTIDLPLFGNQWTLAAGHRIRLDLTEVDYPTFLPANPQLPPDTPLASNPAISFPGAQLVLPTRESTELTIPGA